MIHIASQPLHERIRLVNRVVKSTNQKHFCITHVWHFQFFFVGLSAGCVTKNWGDEPINLAKGEGADGERSAVSQCRVVAGGGGLQQFANSMVIHSGPEFSALRP